MLRSRTWWITTNTRTTVGLCINVRKIWSHYKCNFSTGAVKLKTVNEVRLCSLCKSCSRCCVAFVSCLIFFFFSNFSVLSFDEIKMNIKKHNTDSRFLQSAAPGPLHETARTDNDSDNEARSPNRRQLDSKYCRSTVIYQLNAFVFHADAPHHRGQTDSPLPRQRTGKGRRERSAAAAARWQGAKRRGGALGVCGRGRERR